MSTNNSELLENGVRVAIAGEKFTFAGHLAGMDEQEVHPKGEGNSGQWICCSCGLAFSTQIEKDLHAFGSKPSRRNHMTVTLGPKAKHILAWRSFVSGLIEVP
jgi:hypothetical protein